MKKKEIKKKAENRKARFEYEFIDEYTAGMVLTGCEIKSIREGAVNMSGSYCYIKDGEIFVKNLHISVYEKFGAVGKVDPLRDRKILLTKREIRKLNKSVTENGMTIIPTIIFINENGIAKMKIVLAKGKHTYDKKQSIKEKDIDRQTKRETR